MPAPHSSGPDARSLLLLARSDARAAQEAFDAQPLTARVAAVCEAPVPLRGALIALTDDPQSLVAALPEAELCFTLKAIGLADSGWILAHASDEQLVACVDLDAYEGDNPAPARFDAWIEALARAGDAKLARAFQTLDPELWVLYLRSRVEVTLKDSSDDWEPPEGAQTIDGQFYFRARSEQDDLATLLRLFKVVFQDDYWRYFRLLQGTIWEPEAELEIWAQRWRTGRLLDLGFPPWEEALASIANLPDGAVDALPEREDALSTEAWRLPIWPPQLPTAPGSDHAVFRAAAELDDEERRAFFFAFVAAANAIAVVEKLPLGDAESVPTSIERAAVLASVGVTHLADVHGVTEVAVLRRAPVAHLVQLGAHLSRRAGRPVPEASPT